MCVGAMQTEIGSSARLCANALTFTLSVFGAWGWSTEVDTWPPTLASAGFGALMVLTLLTQQLGNAGAALAQRAFAQRRWLSGVTGIAIALVFSMVTAQGVEHAWSATVEKRREAREAPLQARIGVLEAELDADRRALRAIPPDLPGSRIVILQAPLREAILQADAHLAQLRAELDLAREPAPHEAASLIFGLLAFVEPAFYWMLAGAEGRRAPSVPRPAQDGGVGVPQQRKARHPSRSGRAGVPHNWLDIRSALVALSVFTPGAVAPPQARPPCFDAQEAPRRGRDVESDACVSDAVSGSPPRIVPPRSLRGTPSWLEEALELRRTGLSVRAAGRRLNVPKSTVGRWTKWALAQ
jgi:hypothetical protein